MLLFSTAYATDQNHECQGSRNCTDGGDIDVDARGGSADSEATASSDSYSDSSSSADAESASSSGASSDNAVTISNTRPKSTTVRNVASPDTPNVYPSAPCRIARSAGLSIAGGALSGGSSVEDVECTLRETARAFQYLGVPEVGLHLLCTQSHVINGRRDKKGELEKGAPSPLGTAECLRLVRAFQGDDDVAESGTINTSQIEVIREQQDRVERELVARVNQLESLVERRASTNKPPPTQVTRQTVQQPFLNTSQRSKMAELFPEDEEKAE